MPKINEAEFYGGAFAVLAIFTYGLYKLIPIFFLQAICAFCLFVAIFNLLRATLISLGKSSAEKKFRQFEEAKKILTEKYKNEEKIDGEPDGERKDEKSKDETDFR